MALDRRSLAVLRRQLDEADDLAANNLRLRGDEVAAAQAAADPDAAIEALRDRWQAEGVQPKPSGRELLRGIEDAILAWDSKPPSEGNRNPILDGRRAGLSRAYRMACTQLEWLAAFVPTLKGALPSPNMMNIYCGIGSPRVEWEMVQAMKALRDRLAAAYALPATAPLPAREANAPSEDQTAATAIVTPPPATPEPEPSPASGEASNPPTTSTALPPAREGDTSFENDFLTLDQAAALVQKSKRTLERYKKKTKGTLPLPTVEGGGGKADYWSYATIRPWLVKTFGFPLPEAFPGLRR
jgi:hypothetical protein